MNLWQICGYKNLSKYLGQVTNIWNKFTWIRYAPFCVYSIFNVLRWFLKITLRNPRFRKFLKYETSTEDLIIDRIRSFFANVAMLIGTVTVSQMRREYARRREWIHLSSRRFTHTHTHDLAATGESRSSDDLRKKMMKNSRPFFLKGLPCSFAPSARNVVKNRAMIHERLKGMRERGRERACETPEFAAGPASRNV